ncbi:prepilin peptidase [Novosphingobium sp. Gsoil 351]|uniref:A24 family peptidase n=1 Tax=Novosphingobium sp. Gsoil 351 TaxID=2675225 RepID=UPI0012B47AD2|nr:prepilin peptidase [Novosphingobium sp. Gsoil 351]QGN55329.1 peptidase [Novosphingobium sp. Gsoil 351]
MTGGILAYGLLAALAIALLVAAASDLRTRLIHNRLTFGIAMAAPAFWWASGLSLWPGVGAQLALGLAAFGMLAGLFALGAMGGGDVKLLTALALWLPWQPFLQLVIAMALLGGALTLVCMAWHRIARRGGKLEVPYGVAISAAGLWVIASTYGPMAASAINTGF